MDLASAFVALVVLMAMQVWGPLPYPSRDPFSFDVPFQDVCSAAEHTYQCAFGEAAVATCVAGKCVGAVDTCDRGWTQDAWVTALRNCAQPRFWPWLVTATLAVTVMRMRRDRLYRAALLRAALLLAAFTCLSFNQIVPYWCLLALFFLSVSVAHGLALDAMTKEPGDVGQRRKHATRFFFYYLPIATLVQTYVAVFGAQDYNVFVFATAIVTLLERAAGLLVSYGVFYPTLRGGVHPLPTYPYLALIDIGTAALLSIFFGLRIPLIWVVWPLYCTSQLMNAASL